MSVPTFDVPANISQIGATLYARVPWELCPIWTKNTKIEEDILDKYETIQSLSKKMSTIIDWTMIINLRLVSQFLANWSCNNKNLKTAKTGLLKGIMGAMKPSTKSTTHAIKNPASKDAFHTKHPEGVQKNMFLNELQIFMKWKFEELSEEDCLDWIQQLQEEAEQSARLNNETNDDHSHVNQYWHNQNRPIGENDSKIDMARLYANVDPNTYGYIHEHLKIFGEQWFTAEFCDARATAFNTATWPKNATAPEAASSLNNAAASFSTQSVSEIIIAPQPASSTSVLAQPISMILPPQSLSMTLLIQPASTISAQPTSLNAQPNPLTEPDLDNAVLVGAAPGETSDIDFSMFNDLMQPELAQLWNNSLNTPMVVVTMESTQVTSLSTIKSRIGLRLGAGVRVRDEDKFWGAGLALLSTVKGLGLEILGLGIIRVMDSQRLLSMYFALKLQLQLSNTGSETFKKGNFIQNSGQDGSMEYSVTGMNWEYFFSSLGKGLDDSVCTHDQAYNEEGNTGWIPSKENKEFLTNLNLDSFINLLTLESLSVPTQGIVTSSSTSTPCSPRINVSITTQSLALLAPLPHDSAQTIPPDDSSVATSSHAPAFLVDLNTDVAQGDFGTSIIRKNGLGQG
ncbi:hypothetical protein BT96DRAFT_946050 [Gymnopus androsaceus JB14]|uniref:Uncharacterized protein n=1 Tax=Gymnopus androsaceus JB14 TaxID=1447944 RepID=A0A6A4GXR7_9AGAR|nr:hypothetical protein BT96DRAFT_946050 [Gymnopus androsaceus JB14]